MKLGTSKYSNIFDAASVYNSTTTTTTSTITTTTTTNNNNNSIKFNTCS